MRQYNATALMMAALQADALRVVEVMDEQPQPIKQPVSVQAAIEPDPYRRSRNRAQWKDERQRRGRQR